MGRTPQPKVTVSSSQTAVRVPRRALADLVAFVAAQEGSRVAEVDLAVVAAGEMAALNRRHLRHDWATDVLSFDLSDSRRIGIIAQIIICGDVAVAEAKARGLKPRHELMLYTIHGLLHLMGYDDQSARGAARMRARQEELLAAFLGGRTRGARR